MKQKTVQAAVEVWGIPANDTVLKRELQGCCREIVRYWGGGGGGERDGNLRLEGVGKVYRMRKKRGQDSQSDGSRRISKKKKQE